MSVRLYTKNYKTSLISKSTPKRQPSLLEMFRGMVRPGLSAAKAKDLSVYSDAEIENAQGLDQQRLICWNSRVNELSVSYTSQTTIYGTVEFEWLEKKTHLIQEKAMGFESKVLLKNIKRVDDIHVRVFRNAQIRNSTQGLVKSLVVLSHREDAGVLVENTSSVSPGCRKRRLKGRRYMAIVADTA